MNCIKWLAALALLSCAASRPTADLAPVATASDSMAEGIAPRGAAPGVLHEHSATFEARLAAHVATLKVLPEFVALSGTADRATLQGHHRDASGPIAGTWTWTSGDVTIIQAITSTKSAVTLVPLKNGGTTVIVAKGGLTDTALVSVTGINPLPTGIAINPGDNWQTKIDANPNGTVFIVKTGTHRFPDWSTVNGANPKSAQQFYGEAGAIVTGARVLSTWATSGARWAAGGQTQENTDYVAGYNCEPPHLGCYLPEQLFVNDTLYERMTTLAGVTAGSQTWFFNYANDSVYIGRNPSGQTIETSVTRYAFGGGASNVVIKHLTIERFANGHQKFMINYAATSPGWRVDSNDIRWGHGTGIKVSSNGKMYGNYIHHMGQMGYNCGGSNIIIEGNEVAYNNTAFFGPGPFGGFGAGKCSFTIDLVFRGNNVHHNKGRGPWTDINNVGCLVELNTVDSNWQSGIFHEISFDCVFRNNVVRWNGLTMIGQQAQNAADQAGIGISDSRNVEVYGNTLIGNARGIMCMDVDRQQWPSPLGTHETESLYVHNNTIEQLTGRAAGCSDNDPGHNPYSAVSFNRWGPGNVYTLGSGTEFRWTGNTDRPWAQWNGVVPVGDGQDAGSSQSGQ